MACDTPRTLTWCVSARAPANATSQSTHRGPSLVDARRDVKRDREETPGSVATLPFLVLSCGDDEGSGNGMTRTEKLPHVPSTSLRDVPSRDARECVTKCRPKRDGHTHSRLSVICIIKEEKKREKGREERK